MHVKKGGGGGSNTEELGNLLQEKDQTWKLGNIGREEKKKKKIGKAIWIHGFSPENVKHCQTSNCKNQVQLLGTGNREVSNFFPSC